MKQMTTSGRKNFPARALIIEHHHPLSFNLPRPPTTRTGCPPPGRSVFGIYLDRLRPSVSLRERVTRSHEAVTLVTPAGAAAKNTGKARAIAFRSSHSEFGSSRAPDAIAWSAAMLDLVLALLAGILTIAAPCTLPCCRSCSAPRSDRTARLRPAMIALGFVLSFSAVALLLGAITKLFDFDRFRAALGRGDPAARLRRC